MQADSTLLVKTLTVTEYHFDSLEALSVRTETFNYDTVNRKIMLSVTDDYYGDINYVYTYDIDRRLTRATLSYPDPLDNRTVNFTYDEAGVISKIRTTYADGTDEVQDFVKTAIGLQYKLSWVSGDSGSGNGTPHSATFNADGILVKTTREGVFHIDTNEEINVKDSFVYDSPGNLKHIFSEYTSVDDGTVSNEISYRITARSAGGNNLYILRNLLLGPGLSNLPGGDMIEIDLSILGFDNLTSEPYSEFPSKSGIAYGYDFDNIVVTDHLNRLTRYRSFAVDNPPYAVNFSIEYYK